VSAFLQTQPQTECDQHATGHLFLDLPKRFVFTDFGAGKMYSGGDAAEPCAGKDDRNRAERQELELYPAFFGMNELRHESHKG
jgi:hypothetical protein